MICISLIISNMEHLFLCLSAIFRSSLDKCLFRSAHSLIGFFFLYWATWTICIVWRLIPLVASFENIFSHSVDCLFVVFMIYFALFLQLEVTKFCQNLSEQGHPSSPYNSRKKYCSASTLILAWCELCWVSDLQNHKIVHSYCWSH